MKQKDPNYAVKVEKAIAEKYGEETVQHPQKDWDDEKEKKYLAQLKQIHEKTISEEDYDKQQVNGVLIPKKLIMKNSNRSCPVCSSYSFKAKDDVYMTKFECCYKCYIQWIEDREERWKSGWRPSSETINRTT
tara:strand:- start:1734 stop:2132 length:399 start_codon:yes stop_codon:yes gene_type:complete